MNNESTQVGKGFNETEFLKFGDDIVTLNKDLGFSVVDLDAG